VASLVRFRYSLPGCLPPCTDQTGILPQPPGTFTSRLSTDWSPSPLLDITTTATGLFCWRDSHPLEWQLASLHGHLRPGRASSKSGHVRYGPIATKFRVLPKCREGPCADIDPWSALQFAGWVASTLQAAKGRRMPLSAPRRHAHYGLRHIPCRLAKVTGLLTLVKLQPVTRWIGSLEGNQQTGPPNASQKEPSKTSWLSVTLSAKPGAIARARACRRYIRNAAAATGTTGRAGCR
jgi:hypothetical protein